MLPLALAVSISSAAPVGATAAGSAGQASAPAPKTGGHRRHKPKHKVHKVVKPDLPKVAPGPAALPAPAPLAACADADLVPAPDNVDRLAAAILCLVNQERAVAGIGQVRPVAAMSVAARAHSVEMVAENYLGQISPEHVSPVGRLTQSGYVRPDAAVDISENVAGETGTASTPLATIVAWMSAPSSRGVILSATYIDTGIGVVAAAPAITGSGPGATYTEDFGTTS